MKLQLAAVVLATGLVGASHSMAFDQTQLDQLLREVRCEGCDLSGANLSGANLTGANLRRGEPVRREPGRREPVRRAPVRSEPGRRGPVRREPVRRGVLQDDDAGRNRQQLQLLRLLTATAGRLF